MTVRIIVTGHHSEENRQKFLALPDSYLPKNRKTFSPKTMKVHKYMSEGSGKNRYR